jgi:transcriptional regulator with XRE-family HTH domain
MYADERTVAVRTAKTLGDVLRQARLDKDLGLRELARHLDKSPSYISDIENDRRVPSEEVLAALAKLLGLDFEQLMALAGRLGAETRRLVERSPEAVALFRKISSLRPDQLRRITQTVDEISEKKGRKT